jgi:hypothetical protein
VHLFSFCLQASDVGKVRSLIPGTHLSGTSVVISQMHSHEHILWHIIKMRWMGYLTCVVEVTNAYKNLFGRSEGKRPLGT